MRIKNSHSTLNNIELLLGSQSSVTFAPSSLSSSFSIFGCCLDYCSFHPFFFRLCFRVSNHDFSMWTPSYPPDAFSTYRTSAVVMLSSDSRFSFIYLVECFLSIRFWYWVKMIFIFAALNEFISLNHRRIPPDVSPVIVSQLQESVKFMIM